MSGILYCTVVGAMLCFVGSMFSVNSSLVQLFVNSCLSVLTTYVYSCHMHLTHSNAIVSVCVDVHAVMCAHCEHFIPFAIYMYVAVLVCVRMRVCTYVHA